MTAVAKPRSFKKFLFWVAVAIAVALVWDRWNGALAVMSLCKRDGGEHIFESVHAPGYLVDETNYFCGSCIELIGSRQFEYADARVRSVPSLRFPPDSYLRYSLGMKGDPDCEQWISQDNAEFLLRRAGIGENECVRITALSANPGGYALLHSRSKFTVRGATIELNEWRIEQVDENRVLASVKDYQFTSRLTAVMDTSGHGGNPQSTCLTSDEYVNALAALRWRVLGDPAKQPTQN